MIGEKDLKKKLSWVFNVLRMLRKSFFIQPYTEVNFLGSEVIFFPYTKVDFRNTNEIIPTSKSGHPKVYV